MNRGYCCLFLQSENGGWQVLVMRKAESVYLALDHGLILLTIPLHSLDHNWQDNVASLTFACFLGLPHCLGGAFLVLPMRHGAQVLPHTELTASLLGLVHPAWQRESPLEDRSLGGRSAVLGNQ